MHPIEWTEQDLAGTERAIEPWWALLVAGLESVPDEVAAARAEIDAHAAVLRSESPFDERARAGTQVLDALSRAGRAVHEAGLGAPHGSGSVVGIHVSRGGVPKDPVEHAAVGWRGVEGDRQRERRHHGRVWQALCLWSAEVIDELREEGHPIFPGAAGENVTVRGIDWAALRPGARLRFGDVVAEITVPALPCKKNAAWFVDGDFLRMHHERHPGASRQYARVVEPGEVRVGDAVSLS